ncbi:glutamate--cysteine ligase GCS2 [Thiorhodococcus drewsii AZ1]|uniref:Glutamate--cysteine ligase GCS2 n=1 Tax=Thiorhodococcus drewsii AZ1 TaxID=765913 RepID=G2DXM1_9GAMM|nr:glutamate-cysteine ligase family protein [Thiorhodococcus drewsii]EGV33070.1 glutamate--cysteine ligase GCS2 [Thiorhodococcus drewsii AZ1]
MGQNIAESHFSARNFTEFSARLRRETHLLARWFEESRFESDPPTIGFEAEAWLIDADGSPAPKVETLLDSLADPLIVPELATFNIEFNGTPAALETDAFSRLAAELDATLERTNRAAASADIRVAMIGILPTVRQAHLTLDAMTPRKRYRALNEQVFSLRHGRPTRLLIEGRDRLDLNWHDVMLEAAATSFQVHLKVSPAESARVYNASKILSGPMVAISANSPFLFGHDLWEETRIALFEQAVSVGGAVLQERVNFGFRYAQHSILETFQSNVDRYPVLLPQLMDEPPEQLAHLRLHNGTIWRWNRPLIGFDAHGTPHLRIEHRVMPSGPSVPDVIANMALYAGAVCSLAREEPAPESRLMFLHAQKGFYDCARDGLDATIPWLDGTELPVWRILAEDLIPRARIGLAKLGIDPAEIAHWLGIIEQRLSSRQTGARWQRTWVARHGPDLSGLLESYLEHQRAGNPVHEWTLDGSA